MKRTAFTLLELLLVLAIIATICGLGITSYQRQYARAQFKSGVVQVQVDLHKTRLLAMQSGEAYLFRYVPGTGVYEIAPLKTLQEVLYRIRGEAEDYGDESLGGSLALDASNASAFPSETAYSDDLFSIENIEADAVARNRILSESTQSAQSPDSFGLGGNLTSIPNETSYDSSFTDFESSNANLSSTSGAALTNENSPLGTSLGASAVSMNFRELNAQEKSLTKENSIACRVNNDGVIVRKQATGDVVFTVLRISLSTPSNLRTQRPKGSSTVNSSTGTGSSVGVTTEKALGGSLTSIPDGSEGNGDLGGGLNGLPGETGIMDGTGALSKEEQIVSLWSEPIVFYPNGKTSSAVLGLESVGDYSYYSEIAIRGMTGVARISSISAVPPGVGANSSVLTQEQLFRLSNPMQSDDKSQNVGLATSGSLGGSAIDQSIDASSDALNSFDSFNELSAPSDDVFSGEQQTPNINYGTGRRSGYNVNGNVSSSTNTTALGVSLDQNSLSTLNNPIDGTSVGTTTMGKVGSNRSETSESSSNLNGGSL